MELAEVGELARGLENLAEAGAGRDGAGLQNIPLLGRGGVGDAILIRPGNRAANSDFADALAASDVDAAVAADDRFHGVLIQGAANHEIARSLEQLMPKIRRLERARFGSLAGRRSVEQHERIIALCAAGDAQRAAEAVRENWLTLGALIDRSFGEET